MNTHQLERYAFLWSEIRMVLAGIALIIGGIPPLLLVFPAAPALTAPVLKVCWIISGIASLYLGWRWYDKKMHIFGGKEGTDSLAFVIMIITGLNLGLTGLTGNNLGMSIIGGRIIFFVAGLIYLWVAYHTYKRWKKNGRMVF